MPGPVFGKPSRRSSLSSSVENLSSINSDGAANGNGTAPTAKASEVKIRLIQYEIAEKEACNLISNICKEIASSAPDPGSSVPYREEDIQDLLSGILVLGNICKRIYHDKKESDQRVAQTIQTMKTIEREKKDTIAELEEIILKLQGENVRITDELAEAKLTHSRKVASMNKEMVGVKEQMLDIQHENEKLVAKMKGQENRLMSIPRLEEEYMRQARSVVRAQEVANTINKIEWKKKEEDIKSLNFWKNKTKSLEETLMRQKEEMDNVQTQCRVLFGKYQALLTGASRMTGIDPTLLESGLRQSATAATSARPSSATAINRKPTAGTNATATEISSGDVNANKGSKQQRPLSAPSTTLQAAKTNNATRDDAAKNATKTAAATLNIPLSSYGKKNKSPEELMAEEIVKLRADIATKDRRILSLSKQLSYIRAYPLLSTQGEPDKDDTDMINNGQSNNKNSSLRQSQSQALSFQLQLQQQRRAKKGWRALELSNADEEEGFTNIPYMNEELESNSPRFLKEEKELQEARLSRALQLQEEFNEKSATRKASNPPHIVAIRKSRSFKGLVPDHV